MNRKIHIFKFKINMLLSYYKVLVMHFMCTYVFIFIIAHMFTVVVVLWNIYATLKLLYKNESLIPLLTLKSLLMVSFVIDFFSLPL